MIKQLLVSLSLLAILSGCGFAFAAGVDLLAPILDAMTLQQWAIVALTLSLGSPIVFTVSQYFK